MGPVNFDTRQVQEMREKVAEVIRELDEMAASQPQHGQHLTFAKNHFRLGFMELGYGMALTKGFDPLANKIEKK